MQNRAKQECARRVRWRGVYAGQVARPGGFYARQARQECGALGIEASDAGQECDAGKHKWHLCFRSGQVGGFYAGQVARPGGFYARQARQECGALGVEASDAGQECVARKHKCQSQLR